MEKVAVFFVPNMKFSVKKKPSKSRNGVQLLCQQYDNEDEE